MGKQRGSKQLPNSMRRSCKSAKEPSFAGGTHDIRVLLQGAFRFARLRIAHDGGETLGWISTMRRHCTYSVALTLLRGPRLPGSMSEKTLIERRRLPPWAISQGPADAAGSGWIAGGNGSAGGGRQDNNVGRRPSLVAEYGIPRRSVAESGTPTGTRSMPDDVWRAVQK